MSDDVGGHGDDRDQHALIQDVKAQATGEDAVLAVPGRAGHGIRLTLLQTKGQGGEAVGDQVDKQQVHRVQQCEAQQRGEEHAQHLAHVAGQQELDGLADVVIDPAALLHGGDDGGEVVVAEHHVRHVFRYVRAGDAHAHADIRGLDGGRVVDAVAGHGGDGALAPPGVDNADLMLRLYPGIDAVLLHRLVQFLIGEAVQRAAGNGLAGVGDDAQLLADGHGGILVVAGDHHRADARGAALGHGGLDLRADGVDHARQTDEAEVLLQVLRLLPVGQCVVQALRRRKDPQGLVGHGFVLRQNGGALFLSQGQDLPAFRIAGAPAQHLVRRALGVLDKAVVCAVDGGHHLPAGVKGGLAAAGLAALQHRLLQPLGSGKVHQRRLRGLADGAVLLQRGVVAQRHGCGQQLCGAGVLHHGHLVLCQGAGLVGADDLGAAQRLHRRQPPDHGVLLAHVGHADAQHHRHHRGQSLRDGRHRQGNGHHKRAQHGVQRELAGHHQVKDKDEHADAQHQLAHGLAQLVQLALQGRLLLLRLGQHTGDLAHLRVHAGGGDDCLAAAVDHRAAHVAHILPVAQGHVISGQQPHRLGDGDALAGQRRLLDLHGGALQQPSVGGHGVAGLQQHHVAGHQLAALDDHLVAVPQHLALGGGHGLQGLDGRLGLALLHHAQHRVQQHHHQDDEHLGEALAAECVGHGGHRRRCHQDQQHGVLQLRKEPLQQGGLLRLLQLIGAVLGQTFSRLRLCQTGGTGAQLLQHLLRTAVVFFFHRLLLLYIMVL